MPFDALEAQAWEELLRASCIAPTVFPLHLDGTPAIRWGQLEAGACVPAESLDQGYGIACGSRSGGLVVLDIDVKKGVDGRIALESLPPLPPTLTVRTPSGGTHYYFAHPGKFQSNASKVGSGIDIRAEGGYVRIPGSPPGYELIRAIPPVMLPPAWADLLPRQGDGYDPAPLLDPLEVEDMCAKLSASAKGRNGPLWASWRKIVKGERFVDVAPKAPEGGVDAYLFSLFSALAAQDDWSRVPDILPVMGPSLSILQADDARAGNAIYTVDQIARIWSRATERERARDTSAPAWAQPEGEPPWIVMFNGSGFVRRTEGSLSYRGPKISRDVWLTAREEWTPGGPPVEVPTKTGSRPMSQVELAAAYGQPVDLVAVDTAIQEARLEDGGETLILPSRAIKVQAHRHLDIEAWLEVYDPTGVVQDWIAVVTDLAFAAPALWLTGASGVGKSLLGVGLAQIWGAAPTSMRGAMDNFNSDLLRCPLVTAEEELPTNRRGYPDVERLKDLITETRRSINEKHMPLIEARGALRIILTSNNLNLIRNAPGLTTDDAKALADRFVHHHVPEGTHITAVMPPDGQIQREWINGGRIAEHALYLAETRDVPFGPRLRMAPCAGELRTLFRSQTSAADSVSQAVYLMILIASKAQGDVTWHQGTYWTTATAVVHKLPDDVKKPSRRAVGQALKLIAEGPRRTVGGKKLWPIDLAVIRSWVAESAFGDPDELEAAIKALDGRDEKG